MDDDHLNQLRRLPGVPPQIGRKSGRPLTFREEYGLDDFPVETVLVFRRSGRETRSAVRVDDGLWRLSGCVWLRRWDGMLRKIGHGYELSVSD